MSSALEPETRLLPTCLPAFLLASSIHSERKRSCFSVCQWPSTTWGASVLAEVCCSPQGIFWGPIYSFSHMVIKHPSVHAVLSRASLCSVTGSGQLCLKSSPRRLSWKPADGVTPMWLMKLRCVTTSRAQDRYPAPALAPRSPSCYRISRARFLPGDFLSQRCVGTKRYWFVMLNTTLLHLSLPLRYFQAFILSSDYFSSSSHFWRCSLLLLLFSSAVIAVSPSPIYLLLLVAETTLSNHTANKNPLSPWRPLLTGRNHRPSVLCHQAGRSWAEGFATSHRLLSLCFWRRALVTEGQCGTVTSRAEGRVIGCISLARSLPLPEGLLKCSLAPEQHSVHS